MPVRESIWYLFNCFPVPGALDKLYYLILIIAPGGRNYYPCFIEEETEGQRGKIICKTIKFKARTWIWIWHQRLPTFPLYGLQCRRKKCVCEKWKWLWPSRRIVLPSLSMKTAGPCYVKHQHKFEPTFIEWFHSYRLLRYRWILVLFFVLIHPLAIITAFVTLYINDNFVKLGEFSCLARAWLFSLEFPLISCWDLVKHFEDELISVLHPFNNMNASSAPLPHNLMWDY